MRKGSFPCGGFAATVPLPFAGQVGLNTSINVTPRGWSELLAACLLSAAVTSRCRASTCEPLCH